VKSRQVSIMLCIVEEVFFVCVCVWVAEFLRNVKECVMCVKHIVIKFVQIIYKI
jgi:hypothetical protein